MNWGEVFKINSNLKKPLNEQLRDMKFQPIRIITATGTFTPEKTGLYKVICVGAGGTGCSTATTVSTRKVASGGGGGVAIKTLELSSSTSYNVTVSETASFAYGTSAITATPGARGTTGANASGGAGGTASGGDYNYTGGNGAYSDSVANKIVIPGSVGVFLSELSLRKSVTRGVLNMVAEIPYGDNILGYGGGSTAYIFDNGDDGEEVENAGQPAAVIIVPIEMEE